MTEIELAVLRQEKSILRQILESHEQYLVNEKDREGQRNSMEHFLRTVESAHPETYTAENWRALRRAFISTLRAGLIQLRRFDAMEFAAVQHRIDLAEQAGIIPRLSYPQAVSGVEIMEEPRPLPPDAHTQG